MTENITIRQATEADKASLCDFMAQYNGTGDIYRPLAEGYLNCAFSNDYRKPTFLIAVRDGQIIACGAYTEELFTIDLWGISWLAVHPDHRDRGIGTMMMAHLCASIKHTADKDVSVILATYPGKTKLYEKCGFIHSGEDHAGCSLMVKYLTA